MLNNLKLTYNKKNGRNSLFCNRAQKKNQQEELYLVLGKLMVLLVTITYNIALIILEYLHLLTLDLKENMISMKQKVEDQDKQKLDWVWLKHCVKLIQKIEQL
eukprot:10660_3